MKTYEIEDTSVDAALNNFLTQSGYTKDFIINYEIIENSSKGFMGFGKKLTKIKIYVNDIEFIQRKAKIILSDILDILDIKNFTLESKNNNEQFIINILTEDASLIIGKKAKVLDALQHILDKLLKKYDSSLKVVVDIENYRANFTNSIKEKIDKKIEYVLTTGRREKLNPMVPVLRREIHNYANKKGVRTESIGDGLEKTIYIYPKNRKRHYKNA
jgi:spoIIIJ-associated protein